MEMTLHFKDDDIHEVMKFKRAILADSAFSVIWEINQYFRNKLKHDDDLNNEQYDMIEKIWDEVRKIMDDELGDAWSDLVW